jgi:hypothetical protein
MAHDPCAISGNCLFELHTCLGYTAVGCEQPSQLVKGGRVAVVGRHAEAWLGRFQMRRGGLRSLLLDVGAGRPVHLLYMIKHSCSYLWERAGSCVMSWERAGSCVMSCHCTGLETGVPRSLGLSTCLATYA